MEKTKNTAKNRFLTTFICIFVAIVLSLGGALGLAAGIRRARAVVICGNITADKETVNYLAAYYKMRYIDLLFAEGVSASDTEDFWSQTTAEGKSYGEDFQGDFKEYLSLLVASASVYLTYSTYTVEDKIRVGESCDEILIREANGSVEEFNAETEKYGFDYTDFQNAAALIFKAREAAIATADLDDEEYAEVFEEALSQVVFSEEFETVDLLAIPVLTNYYIEDFG